MGFIQILFYLVVSVLLVYSDYWVLKLAKLDYEISKIQLKKLKEEVKEDYEK